MAQETQYCNFKYILGTEYSGKTEASEISPEDRAEMLVWEYIGRLPNWMISGYGIRIAADSTMLRIVNLLIALSFGVHLEQLEQRMGLTWPRPFLLRPLSKHCQLSTPIFTKDIG